MDSTNINEVTTNASETGETSHKIKIEETSSKPSKGFVALVGGGIAVVAVGVTIAIKNHKKNKESEYFDVEEDDQDDQDLYEDDLDVEEVVPEETEEK